MFFVSYCILEVDMTGCMLPASQVWVKLVDDSVFDIDGIECCQ